MAKTKDDVKVANPTIPPPAIPIQVKRSRVLPAVPIEEKIEVSEEQPKREVDASEGGTINITIYKDKPHKVEFSGFISGRDIDLAWRFMMKEYRVWKHEIFKRDKEKVTKQ